MSVLDFVAPEKCSRPPVVSIEQSGQLPSLSPGLRVGLRRSTFQELELCDRSRRVGKLVVGWDLELVEADGGTMLKTGLPAEQVVILIMTPAVPSTAILVPPKGQSHDQHNTAPYINTMLTFSSIQAVLQGRERKHCAPWQCSP